MTPAKTVDETYLQPIARLSLRHPANHRIWRYTVASQLPLFHHHGSYSCTIDHFQCTVSAIDAIWECCVCSCSTWPFWLFHFRGQFLWRPRSKVSLTNVSFFLSFFRTNERSSLNFVQVKQLSFNDFYFGRTRRTNEGRRVARVYKKGQ